ncbi:MAG: hypothetical protein JXB10_04405 [Pirellulales bacterium]|nr:hypothetical protein [Pirellulales bacterium]
MSNQHAQHGSAKGHEHGHSHPKKYRPHKDWRAWVAVLLMLGAILVYVFSLDESVGPSGNGQRIPAADAAAE